ncbi:MAG: alcohol dehydrogenase catalytic domain-containing protein [Spirochaetota bacterium]
MKALQFNVTVPQWIALKALGAFSKSVFYKSPIGTLKLVDIPKPEPIDKNWAIVKTTYCGFCGSDYNLIQLHDSPMASPFTSFPCVIGHEVCGTIEEPGNTGFKKGQRVVINPMLSCAVRQLPLCPSCKNGRPANCENFANGSFAPGMFTGICKDVNGGFAQYLPAHSSQLFAIPGTISTKAAVLTEPLSVALQAIYDNMPQNYDKVCIIGCGVIGLMLVRALRALNCRATIAVIEPSQFHRQKALSWGADAVLQGDLLEAATFTNGKVYTPMFGPKILQGGFDRVFDTVGSSKTFSLAMNIARAGGHISLVGITSKLSYDPTPLWLKLLTVKGVYGYGFIREGRKQKHIFEKALEIMKKMPDIESMVTHTFSIEQYKEMIEVNANKGIHRAIKTVVEFKK